ncbi:adhesin [Shewanella bicestrii]|uniref:Adhesin n=1 Tax=Shewanella bicestrii TaxID=2018305 RepID=A0A220US21_9GAMM|nr:Ig-like domain-containing protein [Shewanella bicestrii]ASK70780.1 adhesin [Shewanella bicestrii]
MGSIITTKKGLLKLVKGQIEVEVNGSNQPAKDGEQLPKGAVLHIGENATYEITFDDGTKLSNEVEPSIAATPNAGGQATQDEIQALQDLIASGEDPTQNLPETAAGNTPAGRDGNSGYVTLARDGTEALATSGYSTSGQTLTAATTATPEQTVATDSPSVLVNDSITVDEDTVASGNVLDNDSDADNVLSVVGFNINETDFAAGTVVTLEGGSFILNADGSYSFTPNENWNGQVPVITYTTNTGSTATLTINVTPVDDPSVLANDTNTVAEDTVATGNVLDNDTDVDSSLSVVSFTVSGSTFAAGTTVALEGGSLVLNADGSYSFTPNENWNGQVPVITYTTNTGSTATLTINVTPVDDPSVLANDTNTVAEDTVATGNVLDNDTDVDSSLSVVSFTVSGSTFAAGTTVALEGGSLVLNADGSYSFTPNADWNGQVPVITYTTNTGSTATLTINVTPVDDPSVLANDTNTVAEDTVATGNVLDNDTDVDSSLSVVSFTVSGSTFAAGTTVTLEGGSLVLNADGSYSFTPNENWNGQVPVITYTTNTGSTATLTINVTPVADGAPSVTITTDTNDDGFISNAELGGATDVSVTIGLGGTGANAGDTLTVNGVDYVLTQEDINNGYVNLTLPAPAEGETITVVATITDPAGNTSPEGSDSALLDTTAPTITVSAPDDTRDTTPTITGTTDAAPGSVITIVVTDSNGVQQTLTTTVNPDGTYAVDVINPIPHGGYTATATVTDPAGNTGNATDNGNVDIKIDEDGDGNTVAITSITQDTGSSSSDFITNDNTLVFHGTVDLDDNSTLAVTINGVTYTTANGLVIDAQGNWSVDLTGTVLPDGTYPVVATVTDVAGNSKTVTQDVVIDTKIDQDGDGNTVAITSITQDTGSSSSDFITNDNTLVFHGTVDLDDNSTLAVTINGVTYTTANGLVIDAQGNWSVDLTGTVLPDGTYPVVATVTDVAGNSKTVTQDVVIDTKIDQDGDGNTVAITSITQDTGSSSSDFITNDNTLVFHGTVDLDDNSTLAVTINGMTYTTANGLVIDAQGNWSVDLTGTVLPDGTYPVVATVTDVAGNSKTVTQDVVIDTKIDQDGDGNTVAITSITQDTGSSSSDFITNDNTLVFHGTVDLDDNSTLAVTINGVTYTTANGLVIDAQGNWSVDLTGTVLPDGIYTVVATVTDIAGNTTSATQDVIVDTQIGLGRDNAVTITSITEDTGSSNTDFITNDNTLVFQGTVELDGNSNLVVTINGVEYTIGNGLVIDANGHWSVDLTGTVLPDGTYPVVATVTDVAGNSKTVTQDVVIDTKIDQDGDGNTVAITSITQDTGSSSSDFITNDNTLVFHGTVDLDDNSTLAVTINGVTYTTANGLVIDAQGNWSVDLTGTVLPDGTYPVVATVTDVAGNSKTVTQDVVIDTKIDQDGDGNTVAITSITQDTGSSSSDFITNDNTLVFHGTVDLDDNSTLAVTINGVTYTTANGLVIDAQGNWSVDLTGTVLPDGTYPVVATVTDVAGNSKTVTQDVVIDTKIDQDGDGNTVAITSITQDTGSSSSDFITNDNTLVFHGTVDLDDNSTLAVTINGVTYTTANGLVIDAQGNWSVDLTGTVLPDGTYPVVATVTDVAGNSKTVTQDVVIDTKIDQDGDGNTVAITSITQDTGSSSSDFITNDNTLVFHGTVDLDDNSTLAVTINGVTYTTANGLVIDAQGNWSVDLTGTVLPDGTYPVVATVTDVAGNSKTVTQDVVIDTKIDQDGDGNTVAITSITQDTGSSSSDFITNDNTLVFHGTVDLDDNSTLAVTINGVTYTTANGLVIDAQGNWSVDLTGTVLPDGTYPVVATVTDVAGNSKTVTQDVVIDLNAPAVSLTITEDANNDGLLSSAELSGQVNYQVTLGAGTAIGDTLVIVDQDGNVLFNGAVTQTMLDNGLSLAVDAPADGQTLTLTATVTDPAGNTDSASDSVTIDTTAPSAPTVLIVDDGNPGDGLLTQSEINSNGAGVQLTVGINATDFSAGGHVSLTIVNAGVTTTVELTLVNGVLYANGSPTTSFSYNNGVISWTETAPADGQSITVTATQTDAAGNTSAPGSDTATVDTTAPSAPTVLIVDDGNPGDGLLTQSEINSNGAGVQLTVGINATDFSAGGHVSLTIVNAGVTTTVELTLVNGVLYANGSPTTSFSYNNGVISWTETAPADGQSITVTATQTDAAGNTSAPGSDTATVDTTAPSAPTVLIVDDGNPGDGLLTQSEINSNGAGVQLTVGINATDFSAGGHVSLTIVNAGVTTTVELTLVNGVLYANGSPTTSFSYNNGVISWTETAPADGQSITVTATQTDAAGNTSAPGSDTATVDTTAPSAPTVLIVDDGNPGDGLLTQSEINSNGAGVQLTVGINATDFSAGGHVSLTIVNAGVTTTVELTLVNGVLYANGSPTTSFSYNNGVISWTETAPADGQSITVTATQTDAAGNTSAPGSDTATVDTTAPSAPTVLIVDDGNPGDGLLTQSEINSNGAGVQLTVGINATDFSAGGHVSLTIVNAGVTTTVELTLVNGVLYANGSPTTSFSYNNGVISWTETAPADGQSITVTATQTDKAGNTSAEGSDTALVDTTAPTAPTVLIVDDANPDDGLLTAAEMGNDGVQLTVSINGTDFEAGGYVTLTINGGAAIELSFADFTDNGTGTLTYGNYTYANGVISWTETAPADGQSITVTATQTDKAGNTSAEGSDTALVDTTAPTAPTVLIVDDANPDDGLLTAAEMGNDGVQLTVSINGTDFEAGGYVTLTINGGAAIELSFADFTDNGTGTLTYGNYTYANGVISWTETAPADGQSITVTATQTDKAGNTSAEGSDTALVDTTAPTAPTVLIVDDANPDDGLLTAAEMGNDGVQLTVSINGTDFEAGGYVTLTINGGAAIELSFADFTDNGTGTLTYGNYTYANGVISWTETAPADGQSITVTATQTDKAGNTSAEGSDTALVDTTAPTAPTVLIVDDANPDDGLLTAAEMGNDGVQLTVSINGTDFEAGGYVTLTINGGAAIELSFADFTDNGTGTLTYGNYTYANGVISWTETAPADGQSITVTATQTDKAGNTSAEGSDTALVDTTAPTAPTVLIVDDANPDDGLLTAAEMGNDGVQLTVSINGTDFEAGGYVTLTINGGAAIELSFADFTDNGTGTLTYGNYTYANGVISWTETAPADGQSITVTATQTDKAGNTSAEGSDTALVDTTAPTAPTVLIVDDANPDDGLLTAAEMGNDGVQLTVSINGTDFEAGGYVTLTINGGAAIELSFADFTDNGTGTLTYGNYTYANGVISWTETAPADGQSITVTATQTDKAGNTSAEGSDTALVDTTAPTAPTVLIVDDANPDDGLLTAAEMGNDGVQLTVSINGTDFEAGGYVTLTINGGAAIELSFADFTDNGTGTLTYGNYTYANGVISWTETAPADGQSITVTATQTDKAGNTSAEGSDTALVDTTAPTAPTVLIVDDANPDDGLLTAAEMGNDGVQLTVSINGTDFEAGGYVTLTINGGAAIELSFADFTDNGTGTLTYGNYTYANGVISWTETAPADGQSITVTATQTDKAGNTSAEGSDTALVDTTAPTAPTVLIVDDANPDDGLLTAAEMGNDGVQLTVSINGTDFEAGGYVTLTINGGAAIELSFADFTDNGTGTLTYGNYTYANGVISWTETAPADGQSITVTATQTDKAGNTSAEGSDTALVDTTAPTAPTVLIVDDANPDDGLLTAAEMGNDGVQLTVSINGTDFEAGGYVTLTINGGAAIELSFADFTDNGTGTLTYGNYTYANGVISWTETAPADGQSITVTATQTDKAGNTSAEGSDTALVDTTAPTAPTVLIVDDANPDDGLLTAAEMGNDGVQLTVSINGTDFEAGGYVTLTINGGAAIELSFADFTDNGTGTLTYGNYTYANGVISWTETAPADGQSITVTATQTDKAGNTSAEGSDTALVDTTAPTAPTVLIVDDANPDDGLLTAAEMGNDGVQLTVSINGTDFEAGGYVTLTINGGAAIELSFADFTDNGTGTLTYGNYTYANGVISWTETAPADGQSITVTATQTDKAGNTSAEGSDTALVDTTAPTAPTVLIVDDANPDDGLLTAAEMGNDGVQLTVSINGTDFEAGGYVTLTINGGAAIELSFADFTDNGTGTLTYGNYTYANGVISWTETAPADGQSITVTATQTDKAGNTSAEGSDTALVDTTAPTAPTVLIVDDANPDDGLLTQGEIDGNGAGVQLTVSIDAEDFSAGGHVNLTIVNAGVTTNVELKLVNGELQFANGNPATGYSYNATTGVISWTETRPADGALLKVEATQTDKAGNTSDKGSDQATVIYTSDDSFTKQEDQLVTGQLLTNDHSSNTSIVSFTVMYNGTLTSFNAGQTVALSIGSLLIQANGEFKFIPNQHWSGDVSTVTYTTNTGDTATLNITVQPVADKPLVDVILTANGTPLYSGFISSGITTEQFRNGDFTHQPFNTGAKQTDASSGQDTVYGSNGNDHIVSTNGGGDHLLGYAGNDVLVGGDAIQGDTINGGIGNDILVAGLGQDSLYGGEGNDIAVLMGNRADYIITKDYRYSQWDNWFNFTTIEHGQTITKALHDIEYIQFDDGIYELDKNTGELVMVQPTYVDYPVEIHASLTDRDGSELLDSIELSGLPAGTQVFYNGQLLGVADNDGKLLLDYDGPDGWTGGNLWAENALDATLTGVTIRVPGTSAGQVDLVVEAVAREKGTDLTNSATGEDTIRLDYFKGTEGEPGDQNVNFGSEHNIVVGDLDGSIVLPGQNYNIAFMVDSSGSINADTLETMKLQLAQVLETLKDSASGQQSGTVKIFLVDFDTHAKGSISVDLSDPNALDILQDALDDMSSGGGTNYEDVFTTTANWFANGDAQNNSGATNLAFFITDGKPTYYNADAGGNPKVYDTWPNNNDRSLSQVIGTGYVFGQVYTVNGHVVIDENGNVFRVEEDFYSVSRSPVGAMRPDAQGNYQYYALAGNGRDSSADTISNSQAGFALLSSLGVTVQAIGMGSNIDEDDLLPYDSDDNVQTNVDADDLADAILGDQVNAIPGADRFDGGAGDDVIFGDAIHFTGISGQGFAAIKAYVADKLGIADASDAQVHRYISEHSDEFDQSGANDKADIILGGAGNDILFGQGGNDYLDGGAGKDTLYGGNGNDTLIGGAGNDTLIGGAGNDTLIGGLGDDVLRGDSGNDTFVWRYADADKGTDHIMDFNVSEDKLDLSDLLQGETAGTLESYLNFSLDSNGSTVIDIDANKDGVFDQHIVLDGVNLYSQYGATDNAGIINGLLGTNGNGPLIIDAAPVTPDAPQGVTPLIDPHNNGTMIP